jgi:hypothetical protein
MFCLPYTGHMKQVEQKRLVAEYRNPISFMDAIAYRKLRKQRIVRAVIYILIGVGFLVLAVLPSGNAHSPAMVKGGVSVLFLGIGLPLIGVYQILRVRHAVIAVRRAQLLWLHPALQTPVPPKKVKQLPPLYVRFMADGLIIIVVVLAITLWAVYLADH